jgi:hypothetical protein
MTEGIQHQPVRTPEQIGSLSRGQLFAWYEQLADREIEALRAGGAPTVDELWTTLAVQTRLMDEIVATRWLAVAQLLRGNAAESWSAVAQALGMTNAEAARAEFVKWITRQIDLHQQAPEQGLTDETALELREMAHALPLSDASPAPGAPTAL